MVKLRLKENPREWQKAVWFGTLGLAILSTVLRWRRILGSTPWAVVLAFLAALALCAWARPAWFRVYYRLASRAGFRVGQVVGFVMLGLLFLLLVTPLGLTLRLARKDPLRLKRSPAAVTFWNTAKPASPLERLF